MSATIRTTIEADKAGFIEYLTAQRDAEQAMADGSRLKRDQERHAWTAEGMTRAIGYVKSWAIRPDVASWVPVPDGDEIE